MKVCIIGAGSWGSALAIHLARYNDNIHLWDIDTALLEAMQKTRENNRYLPGITLPDPLHPETDFKTALNEAQVVLVAVPSHVFRKVLESLKAELTEKTLVAWVTKGLDPTNNDLLSHTFQDVLGSRPMAMLSGPSFAKEVANEQPTVLDIAYHDEKVLTTLATLFNHGTLHLNPNPNFVAVQLGGALKNIVAIMVGIADGLGFKSNTQSALMTIGLKDIQTLTIALGANPADLINYSGVGDLILTCNDNKSRNRRFGLALGQGKSADEALKDINQVVEGLDNCKLALALAQKHAVELRLATHLQAVLDGKLDSKTAIVQLLSQ